MDRAELDKIRARYTGLEMIVAGHDVISLLDEIEWLSFRAEQRLQLYEGAMDTIERMKATSIVLRARAERAEREASTLAEKVGEVKDLRNELCLLCGKYKEAHKGACDTCRWKEKTNA